MKKIILFSIALSLALPLAARETRINRAAENVANAALAQINSGQERPVVVAYFSASWCPPCRQFKKEYLDGFARTYKTVYKGRLEFVEFDISNKNGRDFKAFAATCAAYGQKSSSIPVAVVGNTFLLGPEQKTLEAAINKALENNEQTRLFYTPQTDLTPQDLIEAIEQGNAPAVKTFLQNSADPDMKDEYGNSALMLAAFFGQTKAAELLISHRADVNYQTSWGYTAALNAAFTGQPEILRLLAENGADLTVETSGGENLLGAAAKGLQKEMIQILVKEYGFDINRPLKTGGTVLTWAVEKRNEAAIAQLLLECGADAQAKYEGKSALDLAKTPQMRNLLSRAAEK